MCRWHVQTILTFAGLCSAQVFVRPATAQPSRPASRPVRKVDITVSRETTYITGPLNADGTVNYVAYLNAKYGKGMTTENNAFVLLLRALGPSCIKKAELRPRFYARLGLQPLSATGKYFRLFTDDCRCEKPHKPSPEEKELSDELDEAMTEPWREREYPVLAAWLRENEQPLALIVEASKRPRYYLPLICDEDPPQVVAALLHPHGMFRQPGYALVARAMLRFRSGDTDAARADLLAARRLSRLLGQGSNLFEPLVGTALELRCQLGYQALVTGRKLKVRLARALLADFQRCGASPSVLKSINWTERFNSLDAVATVSRGAVGRRHWLLREILKAASRHPARAESHRRVRVDWDEILRMTNAWYDRLVDAGRKESFAERSKALEAYRRDLKKLAVPQDVLVADMMTCMLKAARFAGQKNPDPKAVRQVSRKFGTRLLSILLGDLTPALLHHDRCLARGDVVLVATALAVYKAEKRRYPANLDALRPAYLKAIPTDRFTGKPLIYSRTRRGYVLYSVGENLKDDGGDDDYETGDIVVRTGRR